MSTKAHYYVMGAAYALLIYGGLTAYFKLSAIFGG